MCWPAAQPHQDVARLQHTLSTIKPSRRGQGYVHVFQDHGLAESQRQVAEDKAAAQAAELAEVMAEKATLHDKHMLVQQELDRKASDEAALQKQLQQLQDGLDDYQQQSQRYRTEVAQVCFSAVRSPASLAALPAISMLLMDSE
jgi:hypothetical protein